MGTIWQKLPPETMRIKNRYDSCGGDQEGTDSIHEEDEQYHNNKQGYEKPNWINIRENSNRLTSS